MLEQTWEGRHFGVWGMGKQGLAAIRYLVRRGAQVSVIERGLAESHKAVLESLSAWSEQLTFYWEGQVPASWRELESILLSPGVPYDSGPLESARAAGVPTVAALDFASQQTSIPMVAVTGSAGKSTTVSLIGEMLEASSLPSFVGGNLGTPLLVWLNQPTEAERLVIECSSFQLEASSNLRPAVAVLTNLGENHLDRHKTMEGYAACKGQLFRHLDSDAWVVARHGDSWSQRVLEGTPGKVVWFYPEGEGDEGAMTLGSDLVLRHPSWGEDRIPWSALRLRGEHNRENAMAAALAARLAGATRDGIARGMESFLGLRHRLEDLGEIKGVRYFNDSKATTPEAAVRSIQAFAATQEPVHVLLGGSSKGNRFVSLNQDLYALVKRFYLFGESADTIAEDLQTQVPVSRHSRMEEALAAARLASEAGDVILLSPACASFDQFDNFEHRGNCFRDWVLEKRDV